jgi:hypothetical protein
MKSHLKDQKYMVKIVDTIVEKFARMVKKEKVVFIVFTKLLLEEKNKVIEDITEILKEFEVCS